MHDMRHMTYLQIVANEDVAHLIEKERTYQGSWKRRGGVGAFMMLARKWDRLEGMVECDNVRYDVFAAVSIGGMSGADGTALAEIRDLRRYLLLVEAEMTARAANSPGGEKGDVLVKWHEIREEKLREIGLVDPHLERATREGISREVAKAKNFAEMYGARTVPRYPGASVAHPSVDDAVCRPGTPEDGGQHEQEDARPWVVSSEIVGKLFGESHVRDVLYQSWGRVAKLGWYLSSEEYRQVGELANMTGSELLRSLLRSAMTCYRHYRGDWYLDRAAIPDDYRDAWPRLDRELNGAEHESADLATRKLYDWHEGETKWKLRREFLSWAE